MVRPQYRPMVDKHILFIRWMEPNLHSYKPESACMTDFPEINKNATYKNDKRHTKNYIKLTNRFEKTKLRSNCFQKG